MRIFVIGPTDPDSFADNVVDTLKRMGHDAILGGPARKRIPGVRVRSLVEFASDRLSGIDALRQAHLVAELERLRPDLVLTVDRRLHGSVIARAHELGTPCVLWFPDHVSSMGRHDMFIAGYDRIYLKNPTLVAQLRDIYGLPVSYLPEACNSGWHSSSEKYGTDPVVVLAGNVHPTRRVLLERLIRDGFPVRIYGGAVAPWLVTDAIRDAHTGDYIARRAKADVFRRARVVLNNLHPAEFAGSNCRLFEACGSGALVLTEGRDELGDFYVPGSEVQVFNSYLELQTKLEYFVGDPSRGASIANAAAERSHREHTYEYRLEEMLADLAL